MSIIKKVQLKKSIKKFYKTFGEELHRVQFTIKLRDFNSYDFLHDIQFDIHEILEANSNCFCSEAYGIDAWLNKINNHINTLKEKAQ